MADVAVRVEGLSKRYRIGRLQGQATTLRESLVGVALSPLARFREAFAGVSDAQAIWALRDVSFELQPGEVLGIVGRNGAGKTTLLKVLSRITDPTEGRAEIFGRVSSLLEVGTGFHSELTGRENVYLNGAILGMRRTEIEARFDEIVEFSGVERFLDTPVKRYSSGMLMRLAFAVAAHLEPDVLIVDEVLAVGDAEFQKRCLGKMRDVTQEGRTVLFVSHNLGAVQALCTRAILLHQGRLVADGGASRVIEQYLSVGAPSLEGGLVDADVDRIGSGEARFTHIVLSDGDGRPLDHAYFGQRLSVQMTLEADQLVPEAIVELGVTSAGGVRVLTTLSVDVARKPMRLEPGETALWATIDARLLPGQYSLDVGVHKPDGRTVDMIERVVSFEVLNVAEDGTEGAVSSYGRGFVRPATEWGEGTSQ